MIWYSSNRGRCDNVMVMMAMHCIFHVHTFGLLFPEPFFSSLLIPSFSSQQHRKKSVLECLARGCIYFCTSSSACEMLSLARLFVS